MKKNLVSTYTDLDRLSLLKYYFESGQTKASFSRSHGFTASALNLWLARYGVSDLSTLSPIIKTFNMPGKEEELQEELRLLRQENKRLEKELRQSKFRNEALNLLVDLAESTYKIPIRKKSDAK